jgi:hypothetical protein
MPFLSLQKPLTTTSLITMTCHLYAKSFFSTLPLNMLLILGYHFIQYGNFYLPPHLQSSHGQIAMFVLILMLPLSAAHVYAIYQIGRQGKFSYRTVAITTCQRFLSLIGCFVSMLLLPAIVLGVCLATHLFIEKTFTEPSLLMTWKGFTFLIVFATFIPKLFAPLLVFIDKQDIELALNTSTQWIKDHFIRTFCLTLYGIVLLYGIARLSILASLFPLAEKGSHYVILLESLSYIGLILVLPWFFALLIMQKQDLEYRKKQKTH